MSKRARAMGLEHAETEAQMDATNDALDQDKRRREIAKELAITMYGTTGDCIFEPFDATDDWTGMGVESRDGGYWVAAKCWVPADDVEHKLNQSPRLTRILEYMDEYGQGRLEDMDLDLTKPDRFLLVQSDSNEPWYVLLESVEDVVQYIKQDYPAWDFEVAVDLDTGQEYDLLNDPQLTPK